MNETMNLFGLVGVDFAPFTRAVATCLLSRFKSSVRLLQLAAAAGISSQAHLEGGKFVVSYTLLWAGERCLPDCKGGG